MTDVDVVVLHPEAPLDAGPLTRALATSRRALADRHVAGFLAAGVTRARVVVGPADERPFGDRLRDIVEGLGRGGLIVLGSGAIPLATASDRRAFVAAAAADVPGALANNRYSADIVAIACARAVLAGVPRDLASDNALPRWLADAAGIHVADRRGNTRLAVDIDGPLDLVLLGGRWPMALPAAVPARVQTVLTRLRRVAADPHAELLVAGRLSSRELAWLERGTASRTRALVEERGLRTAAAGQRAARSVLGLLLDRTGARALGGIVAELAGGALVDSRVLLAHRVGTDERRWPTPEDRYASDLLVHETIVDPWLRDLTRSAAEAPVPVVLGGHTLVGPGLRLALRPRAGGGATDARRQRP
ncbi:MAG TPA: hypothetical protein VFI69_08945 [Candidatus Limnocylindrales bacterium]|nr:hypothetical protein [Candidatus Limnocylindrales bacterium]